MRFARLTVFSEMLRVGVLPLYYEPDLDTAVGVATACAKGGAMVIEFTNRGPGALDTFRRLLERLEKEEPRAILGAGTVVDVTTAGLFIDAGANFIVSPAFDEATVRLCNRRGVAYLPGCSTPREIANAQEFGAEIVKIFPGEVLGPAFVKAVMATSPQSRLMPTGGVEPTEESVGAWIRAGASCLGMGSKLISTELLERSAFEELTLRVQAAVELVRGLREAAHLIGRK